MSSIASDCGDYDMGDYDCGDEGYRYDDDGAYGGYENSHDHVMNENESYYSGGGYDENDAHCSYDNDEEYEESCEGADDDDRECDESYTSHPENEGAMRYHPFLYTPCKSYDTSTPKVCEGSHIEYGGISYSSPRGVCGYASSSRSQPTGRRECSSPMSTGTTSYTSYTNSQVSGYRNQSGFGSRAMIPKNIKVTLPTFEGKHDPEAYLDWEWRCGRAFQSHDLSEFKKTLDAIAHFQGNASSWWYSMYRGPTLTWEELKRYMRSKYVPEGYKKLYNVDPRRQVLERKMNICGISGFNLVFDDWCYANYITPSTIEYLRIPRVTKRYPYILDGYNVTQCVKVSFGCIGYYEEVWCDVLPMNFSHLFLGAN